MTFLPPELSACLDLSEEFPFEQVAALPMGELAPSMHRAQLAPGHALEIPEYAPRHGGGFVADRSQNNIVDFQGPGVMAFLRMPPAEQASDDFDVDLTLLQPKGAGSARLFGLEGPVREGEVLFKLGELRKALQNAIAHGETPTLVVTVPARGHAEHVEVGGLLIAPSDAGTLNVTGVTQVMGYRRDVTWTRNTNILELAPSTRPVVAHVEHSAGERVVVLDRQQLHVYAPADVLDRWLEEDRSQLADPGELIAFLIAARANAAARASEVRAWLQSSNAEAAPSLEHGYERVREYLERGLPVSPPDRGNPLLRWLSGLSRIEQALEGLPQILQVLDSGTDVALTEFWSGLEPVLRSEFEARSKNLAALPQRWLRARRFPRFVPTGTELGVFDAEHTNKDTVITAWLRGRLHVEDSTTLRAKVQQAGVWQQAYREHVQQAAAAVTVTLHAADSVLTQGVATSVLHVPLPHLGHHVIADVQQTGAKLRVVLIPNGEVMQEVELPASGTRSVQFVWGDTTTGELHTQVEIHHASNEERLFHLVERIEELVSLDAEPVTEAEGVLLAGLASELCRVLQTSPFVEWMQAATRCFDEGNDPDEDSLQRRVAEILRARLVLEDAAVTLYDDKTRHGDLALELVDLDEVFTPFGHAVLLLDRDTYRGIVARNPVDEEAWWGIQAKRKRHFPEGLTEALFKEAGRQLRAERQRENAAEPANRTYPSLESSQTPPLQVRDKHRVASGWNPEAVESPDESESEDKKP